MEDNVFLRIKCFITAGILAFTLAFGWMGWLVVGWVACMAADWLSGSAAAAKKGEWSSSRARDGIWHKTGMVLAVLVAAGADLIIGLAVNNLPAVTLPFDYSVLICPVLLLWYIFTELGSILENAQAMGAPIPDFLVNVLAAGKKTAEKAGDAITPEEKIE